MVYELWDTCSGDLVGTFASKVQALGIVRDTAALHGVAFAEWFLLLGQGTKGEPSRHIAEGKALVALALAEANNERAHAS